MVGTLAAAELCESLGTPTVLGGVSWERYAIDPHPGPWPLQQILDLIELSPPTRRAALTDGRARAPNQTRFAESRLAAHLGQPILLVDVCGGPADCAEAIVSAADSLRCDLVIYLDVGGDAIADGTEPGLASPLCDAVMLAAARLASPEVATLATVFGAGCDGELTIRELLGRIAVIAESGAWLGTRSLSAAGARRIETAAAAAPTEASLLAARAALGSFGATPIRDGARQVDLTPLAALSFWFDPLVAYERVTPLAAAVEPAGDLEAARAILADRGLRTELDYERNRANSA